MRRGEMWRLLGAGPPKEHVHHGSCGQSRIGYCGGSVSRVVGKVAVIEERSTPVVVAGGFHGAWFRSSRPRVLVLCGCACGLRPPVVDPSVDPVAGRSVAAWAGLRHLAFRRCHSVVLLWTCLVAG